MIDAVNVAPSVSPRAVIPSSSSSSSSSSSGGVVYVSSFRPVLLRVVQTEQRAKKRDENVEERPEDVRDRGGTKQRFARPRRPGRGHVGVVVLFCRRHLFVALVLLVSDDDKRKRVINLLALDKTSTLFEEDDDDDRV